MAEHRDRIRPRTPLTVFLSCALLASCSSEADSDGETAGAPAGPVSGSGESGSSGATVSAGSPPGGGGSTSTGGATATAGTTAAAGSTGSAGTTVAGSGGTTATTPLEPFSFFVTSLVALQRLSGSPNGFGGDLRYGEADGLSGADKICSEIAETSMPGSSRKVWRAFLSAVSGPGGAPVNAIDRIGEGPWYDRLGRLFAMDKQGLIGFRPAADPAIADDFPNEDGVPNHNPDGTGTVDNHDSLTGTNSMGQVYAMDPQVTCNDWTTSEPVGRPRVGHAWPRFPGGGFPAFPGGGGDAGFPSGPFPGFPGGGSGTSGGVDSSCFMNDGTDSGGAGLGEYGHWMSSLSEAGCAPVIYLTDDLNMDCATRGVGAGGGYGGFYCFALEP